MAVRIERIKINRQGPLSEDFVFQPGDVNLVYGPNETGKTFIVEKVDNLTAAGCSVNFTALDGATATGSANFDWIAIGE